MGLDSIIRNAIGIANTVTKPVQADIVWEAWVSQDAKGRVTYADPVYIKAIVDTTRKHRPTSGGKMVTIVATLTILDTVPAVNVEGTRFQPIDPRDRIMLPDGTTGPIFDGPGSVFDPVAERPFVNEIMLSEVARVV